jgi:hypothetical protein
VGGGSARTANINNPQCLRVLWLGLAWGALPAFFRAQPLDHRSRETPPLLGFGSKSGFLSIPNIPFEGFLRKLGAKHVNSEKGPSQVLNSENPNRPVASNWEMDHFPLLKFGKKTNMLK